MYQPPPGYYPHIYYPPAFAAGHHGDESSRAAFEKLAQDNSHGELSQTSHLSLSQMKKIMDNETEVATTIAEMASKTRTNPSDDTGKPAKRAKTNKDQEESTVTASLQTGALERAGDADEKSEKPSSPSTKAAAASGTAAKKNPPLPAAAEHATYESPDKSKASSLSLGPLSPGLSPDALAVGQSDLGHNGTTVFCYDLKGLFSDGADSSKTNAESPDKPDKALFGEDATLMENDLEAITVLNGLSRYGSTDPSAVIDETDRGEKPRAVNDIASRKKKPVDETDRGEKPRAVNNIASRKKKPVQGKSLFARVVAGANQKTKSKSKRL